LKAARVAQVIEYMETRQLEARVIDANLSKKVLVRLRKDP
jgi:cell division protein FtsQ